MPENVIKDARFIIEGRELSTDGNEVGVAAEGELLARDVFGSASRSFVSGLTGGSWTFAGYQNYGTDQAEAILSARLGVSSHVLATAKREGIGGPAVLWRSAQETYNPLSGKIGELQMFTIGGKLFGGRGYSQGQLLDDGETARETKSGWTVLNSQVAPRTQVRLTGGATDPQVGDVVLFGVADPVSHEVTAVTSVGGTDRRITFAPEVTVDLAAGLAVLFIQRERPVQLGIIPVGLSLRVAVHAIVAGVMLNVWIESGAAVTGVGNAQRITAPVSRVALPVINGVGAAEGIYTPAAGLADTYYQARFSTNGIFNAVVGAAII